MSLDISESRQPTQDSFFSIELATQSNHFTPIMGLESASHSSSDLAPRILHFADHLKDIGANIKTPIDLLYGSRIYESFDINQDTEHSETFQIHDFKEHSLRTE
jgi:hypothetical protein